MRERVTRLDSPMVEIAAESKVMQSLPHSERQQVTRILSQLIEGLKDILGDQLVGIYLYGSLITGDFNFKVSDIDLVVVLEDSLDDRLFASLYQLHTQVVSDFPAWDNRLELAYISRHALLNFRTQTSAIGIISPGEPFHLIQAGSDWLISWYALRETGIAQHGPPIQTLIKPMPLDAWLESVREHVCHYRESVKKPHGSPALSYIVLTVARGLYTLEHGYAVSKTEAAEWAVQAMPKWADLIRRALRYRHAPETDHITAEQLRPQVAAFVADVLEGMSCGDAKSRT